MLNEKLKLKELISDNQYRINSWIEKAENVFNFAEKAKESFENGDFETKKTILSCLGSNLILKDQLLSIELNKPISLFNKHAIQIQNFHNRLEPTQSNVTQESWEDLYRKNIIWRPQGESNPCYRNENPGS